MSPYETNMFFEEMKVTFKDSFISDALLKQIIDEEINNFDEPVKTSGWIKVTHYLALSASIIHRIETATTDLRAASTCEISTMCV